MLRVDEGATCQFSCSRQAFWGRKLPENGLKMAIFEHSPLPVLDSPFLYFQSFTESIALIMVHIYTTGGVGYILDVQTGEIADRSDRVER